MKYSIILLLFSIVCYGQTVQSSCIAPDSIKAKYWDDANKMAVRYAYHIGDSYEDSITVNRQIRNKYLDALIAVYNATAIPARDSVVKHYNVHIYGQEVSTVVISADSNLQWMKNIKNHITPSGNQKIDFLFSKYYFKEKQHYNNILQNRTDIYLESDTGVNSVVLADTLRIMPGIQIASGGVQRSGAGTNIQDSITTNYTWLIYSFGWDDDNNLGFPCPTGCLNRRFWQFRVYNDCSVEYGGSFGAPLGVSENKIAFEGLKVFPNPTKDKLKLQLNDMVKVNITIYNTLGQVMYYENDVVKEIDIGTLPVGVYYLKLQNEAGFKVVTVLKE